MCLPGASILGLKFGNSLQCLLPQGSCVACDHDFARVLDVRHTTVERSYQLPQVTERTRSIPLSRCFLISQLNPSFRRYRATSVQQTVFGHAWIAAYRRDAFHFWNLKSSCPLVSISGCHFGRRGFIAAWVRAPTPDGPSGSERDFVSSGARRKGDCVFTNWGEPNASRVGARRQFPGHALVARFLSLQ